MIEDRYQAVVHHYCQPGPIKDWHPDLDVTPTMADAICDRLLHNAYKIDMRGDSMRTKRPVTKARLIIKEVIERENKLS